LFKNASPSKNSPLYVFILFLLDFILQYLLGNTISISFNFPDLVLFLYKSSSSIESFIFIVCKLKYFDEYICSSVFDFFEFLESKIS
jgi:hypothetical protein